jgi:hypothetical protein
MASGENKLETHPRTFAKGTNAHPGKMHRAGVRTIVYAPSSQRSAWIDAELERAGACVQIGRSIDHVVLALTEDPAPRPQMLVIDVDALSGAELLRLHAIRESAWFGTIVALGTVPRPLRTSLAIARVLQAPFVEGALVESLERKLSETSAMTVPMPIFAER